MSVKFKLFSIIIVLITIINFGCDKDEDDVRNESDRIGPAVDRTSDA